jgi:hypothetical protein
MKPLEQIDYDDSVDHGPITYGEFVEQEKVDLGNENWEKFAQEHKGNFAP